ncbi:MULTISPECIES: HMA2 domain-containing protein [unclassified Thiocapsa]|uniref:HMA2 domain-containing protein n=1 Tax=unclassified Thiocapsa TaxID=2641286 RepID=UPI0035B4427B
MKVCHQTSGRLRLRISALHQDRGVADRIELALRGQAGILTVRANPACASLVVHYEVEKLDAPAIQERVHALLNPAASVTASHTPPIERAFQRAWSRVRRALADWTTTVVNLARSRDRLASRRRTPVRVPPRKPEAPILLCRLNLRLTRWMLRTSARGWRDEIFPGRPPQRTRKRAASAQSMKTHLAQCGRTVRREAPWIPVVRRLVPWP